MAKINCRDSTIKEKLPSLRANTPIGLEKITEVLVYLRGNPEMTSIHLK